MAVLTTTISRRYGFCASHRLHSADLSEEENTRIYGKCNNPYGHGHDYVLDVKVTGQPDGATGLIVKISQLDEFVRAEVLTAFAYKNLNQDVVEFGSLVPTTENVSLVIAQRLQERWSNYFPYSSAYVSGISMQETARNSFEVLTPRRQAAREMQSLKNEINESVIVNA